MAKAEQQIAQTSQGEHTQAEKELLASQLAHDYVFGKIELPEFSSRSRVLSDPNLEEVVKDLHPII